MSTYENQASDIKKVLHYDVIIVGAGMVGATLACALAEQGMQVLILDSALSPQIDLTQKPGLRVSAIHIASVNFLKKLQVWPLLSAKRLRPFTHMEIWETNPSNHTIDRLFKTDQSVVLDCQHIGEQALGYFIENDIFQAALHERLEALPTAQLLTGVSIDQFINPLDHAEKRILLTNKNEYVSPLIIGADGMLSQVRSWSGIQTNHTTYGQSAFVATVELPTDPGFLTWQAFTAQGPMAFLPLPVCANRYYASLVWYHTQIHHQALMALSDVELIRQISQHFPQQLPPILSLVSKNTFPLSKQIATSYVKPGVALIGDAAHTVHPLAGQGLNLGLQDAITLTDVIVTAWKKGEIYASLDVLKTYQQIRQADTRHMIWLLEACHYGFMSHNIVIKCLRKA
ncbi:MAG: NAD(P)-binding protein, partial [Endozoicomonadaceae bacterium]|nr:NAD(P)-binding protein [Endozoicomonadaceae bacterium]